ncbi:MAG: glycosyltransferase family 2 protein [Pseudomonadota bacterium]
MPDPKPRPPAELPSATVILCSRNGADRLEPAFASIEAAAEGLPQIDVVLVDSASEDGSRARFEAYRDRAPRRVAIRAAERPGLGRARNLGIRAALGEWLFFLDDDGRYAPDYFARFVRLLRRGEPFDFGGGEIWPAEEGLDPRVATLRLRRTEYARPGAMFAAGWLQGANLFFHRRVFEVAGPFNPHLGAGGPFAFEDVEMCSRASAHGFQAVRARGLTVLHDHGRRAGSEAAERTVESYDLGRGAYKAHLLANGRLDGLHLFAQDPKGPKGRARRRRELLGAARYLEAAADAPEIYRATPYPPAEDAEQSAIRKDGCGFPD